MDKKEKLERAINQVKQEKESDKIASAEDPVMFCGCSKHKSKQANIPKLDKAINPSKIIENKKQ